MSAELDWLHARGLTDDTIKTAGLTWNNGQIKFPWRVGGKEVGYQIRWIEEKRFKFNDGFDSNQLYFPSGELPPGYDVWVTEGAIDALILSQLGYPAVAIPSATSYRGVSAIPARKLYLALDNDEPGNLSCEAIAALGSPQKLFRAIFDGKDPNENFLKYGTFKHEVVPYVVGGIKHIKDIHLNGNITNNAIIQFTNGLPSWNQGDLVVVYGREKSGKTSWVLKTLADEPTVPVLIEEYEMLPEHIKNWFINLGGDPNHPLYITTEFKDFNIGNMFARVHSAVSQLGVRVIVVDHVHFLASGKENVVNILANVTQKLKLMAMKLRICIVLIAHETQGEIRDCRLIGGNADSILHLKRLNNALQIEGVFRYHPQGNYLFPKPVQGVKDEVKTGL